MPARGGGTVPFPPAVWFISTAMCRYDLLSPAVLRPLAPSDEKRRLFNSLLEKPWGMLCLMDGNNMNSWFVDGPESFSRYLQRRCWFTGTGWMRKDCPLFASHSFVGESLWRCAQSCARYALANLGVLTHLFTRAHYGL